MAWIPRKLRLVQQEMMVGLAIRNFISRVASAVHPYVSRVIPNFKAAHYTYIIFWVFFGSILMYPVHNLRYIDVLFLSGGASTQAGLNTVDINSIKLWQQMVMYIVAMLTTPIFIHGLLLFWRLFFFERYFDGIKERSKMNFKMRRNATLAARTRTNDSTRVNTISRGDERVAAEKNEQRHGDTSVPSSDLVMHVSEPSDSEQDGEPAAHRATGDGQQTDPAPPTATAVSPPAGTGRSSTESDPAGSTSSGALNNAITTPHNLAADLSGPQDGIRFGALPHPRKAEIEPSDMYRSIAMLQRNRQTAADDDDVLIIKSPNEIENDGTNPIFTKRLQILFTVNRSPIKDWKRRRRRSQWSKLRTSFSNTGSPRHHRRPLAALDDGPGPSDDESIDSEQGLDFAVTDDSDHEGGIDERLSQANDEEHTDAENNEHANPHPGGSNRRKRFRRQLLRLATNFTTASSRGDSDPESEDGFSTLNRTMSAKYLSWVPTVGRNSTFVHLTDEQKDELGGVEYRAIKLLIKIIVVYYVGFHCIAFTLFWIWIAKMPNYQAIIRAQGISTTWWAFFTAQSAFNDLGFTLTSNSMGSFNRSYYVMIVMSFFIVIGNTGFPVFLRFIIWILFKLSKPLSLYRESLGFLLDHPRRCFTLLFPSVPTWWLFLILVVLNAVDLILFAVLDLHNEYLKPIPTGYRVMDGLFQAFSTRTAGFSVLDLSRLHSAVQVSYMLMMYISVLPLAISIRRTNVYEEQSLGVYLRDNDAEGAEDSPKNFVGAHLRNQLSFDLWFIFLGLFIICIAEGGKLDNNNYRFSVFSILFEIISAYGTVGMSLGYPGVDTSLSGQFTSLSKLVIVAMMVRGRHRGLPYSLDRAIMLPDKQMEKRDRVQESHALRREQTLEPTSTIVDNPLTRMFTRRASASGLRQRRSRSSAIEMNEMV